MSEQKSAQPASSSRANLVGILILTAITALVFLKSFGTNSVVFSNDGPLGVVNSAALRVPEAFKGFWMDSHWIGLNGKHAVACLTYGLLTILGPVDFARFYPAFAILLAGLGAFVFFRTLGLSAALATVGAIGAALNSNFFSNTCWGLGSRSITLACIFLALAALSARRVGHPWLNAILAGLAVGLAVVEGADNGVIFSLFVAAFVLWQGWFSEAEGGGQGAGSVRGLLRAGLRLALVAGFAGFMATQSLISLFDIASKGAVSATADAETKEQNWSFATQWSLPPAETIRVLIPGLYGYRMDSPDGGLYWGRVGETPGAPGTRFSGAGEYAGVLVVLLAVWSLAQSFRRKGSPFTDVERRMMWFWGATLALATILAWGKYTPLYGLTVYQLPYFSSIRNPMKFMHVAHLALMILFGYALLGLSRRYLTSEKPARGGARPGLAPPDKRWALGMFVAAGLSFVAYLAYASNEGALMRHLMTIGFNYEPLAKEMARFSIAEVGKFAAFLALSTVAVWLVLRGVFAGKRATLGAAVLGLVLTVDLARANGYWLLYWDYQDKYASNPIIDLLREKPWEARVVAPQLLMNSEAGGGAAQFPSVYQIEWLQHHFQYFNIQSVDVSQDPRPPADKRDYMIAVGQHPEPGKAFDFGRYVGGLARYWELTNTRYILGMSGFIGALNNQIDKGRNRFVIRKTFDIAAKPGYQHRGYLAPKPEHFNAVEITNGPLALFEFTGALPRAKLYARWQVVTNGNDALKALVDPAFDPWSAVIVSDDIASSPTVSTNADGGTVAFASYAPRRIELRANATAPSVLLLNDRFDPDWQVTVDGQPAKLLRANFIMRGVPVPAGAHTVVFEFRPSLKGLKISLAAIALSGVLCGLLFFVRRTEK